MGEVISAAVNSFVQEPLKSVTNAATTGTGVMVAPNGLDLAIGVVGLCVSLGIGFHTYIKIKKDLLDMQIKRAELATIGRRKDDKQ
jgi:hypothetical protein